MEIGLRKSQAPSLASSGYTLPSVGAPVVPTDKSPGLFNINLADPVGSAVANQKESDDFIHGLGQVLFGKDNQSALGGVPVLGEAVRQISSVPGVGIPSAGVGAALGLGVPAAVAALERIPTGWIPGVGSDQVFDALPHTLEWQTVNEAANRDVLAGGNMKFDYAQKYFEDQQGSIKESQGIATLAPGLRAGPGGSFGGMIGQALGIFQLPQRFAERGIAGTGKILTGMNRVQETLARASNGEKLTPVEQAVVQHVGDESWTEDRALDFMASHGSGLSHDQTLQLVGSFATDPTVIASLGTAGLARLGIKGAQLAAQGITATTRAQRLAAGVYAAETGATGQIAKIGRTIIDPLSAIGGKTLEERALLDLYSRDVGTRGFLSAHASDLGQSVFRDVGRLGMDSDKVLRAAASRGATYSRYILAEMKQAELVKLQHADAAFAPSEAVELMARRAPRDIERRVEELVHNHREFLWNADSKSALAKNLVKAFGGDAGEVEAWTKGLGDDNLGLLHDLLYAGEEGEFRKLLQGIEEVPGGDAELQYVGDIPLSRLNMFDHTTLTDLGAGGFIKRIGKLNPESDEAKAILKALQEQFPATRRYGTNVKFALDDLGRRLEAGREGNLPHQVTRAEMADMPVALRDWFVEHPHRTLGFRPEDGQLWNIDRDPISGLLTVGGEPWVEHVFPDAAYRPGEMLPFNIAGSVVKVTSPTKALDWLVAGPRLLTHRISGTMIRQQSEQNFVKAALKYNGDVISEPTARAAFHELTNHLDTIQNPTVTSLKPHELFDVARRVLPHNAQLTERDVLRWVVEGFEGDLSKVGLGQKIPNKIRSEIAKLTGSNAMYEISQEVYGQIKFRGPLAIRFKAQETIEPHVLNMMEGSPTNLRHPQLPDAMVESLDRLMSNLSDTSFLRTHDQTDLLEQSAYLKRSQVIRAKAGLNEGTVQRLLSPQIMRQKRIAQTRMMGARIGSAVREGFKADGREEEFNTLKQAFADASGATAEGRVVTDAEYAVHWLHGLGGEIVDETGKRVRVEALMDEAQRWSPSDVGQVKRLALDETAALLDGMKGHTIRNLSDLFDAMKPSDSVSNDLLVHEHDIREALAPFATKEYVDRFLVAYNFDWGDFWRRASVKFAMDAGESKRMQTWVSDIARAQGMLPVEFLSQVVSSGMRQRWTAREIESNLAKGLDVLRTPRNAKPGDLISQLSEAFVGHLHPSGRAALIRAMQKDQGMAVDLLAEGLPSTPRADSILQRAPFAKPVAIKTWDGEVLDSVDGPLGEGFYAQTPEVQNLISGELDRLEALTGIKISHFDIRDITRPIDDEFGSAPVDAEAFATSDGGVAIIFDPYNFGPEAMQKWAAKEGKNAVSGSQSHFPHPVTGLMNERQSNPGVLGFVDDSLLGTMRHEFGHAIERFIWRPGNKRKYKALNDYLALFEESPAARQMSEYAMAHGEHGGELLGVALDQNANLSRFAGAEIQAAYDAGNIAKGKALNRAAGIARGGTAESGGAMRPETQVALSYHPVGEVFTKRGSLPVFGRGTGGINPSRFGEVGDIFTSQHGLPYQLRMVPLDEVKSSHATVPERVSEYGAMPGENVPPVTLGPGGFVQDGNHRVEVARQAGKQDVLAYVFVGNESDLPNGLRAQLGLPALATEPTGVTFDANDAARALNNMEVSKDIPAQARPGYMGEPGAPQTVEEAVTEARRLMTEAGLMKEPPPAFNESMLTEDFARRMTERAASAVPSDDPVLENAFRYFGDWARATMKDTALGSGDEGIRGVLSGLPQGGKEFDHTQGALLDQVYNRLGQMENETYRLQFFARDRSLFERSINHPMFALYPASYMWFKIMPQMLKFIADRPFGLKTGALAYSLLDVQKDVAIQREYDPEFMKRLDGAATNPLVWFMGLMLPATPWDIPALWPAWARDLAGQGLQNEARAAKGRPTKGLNISSVATHAFAPIDPMASLNLGLNTSKALGDILTGSTKEQRKAPGQVGLTAGVAGASQQLAEPLTDALDELTQVLQ